MMLVLRAMSVLDIIDTSDNHYCHPVTDIAKWMAVSTILKHTIIDIRYRRNWQMTISEMDWISNIADGHRISDTITIDLLFR